MILPDDLHVCATPRPAPIANEISIALRAIGVNLDVPPTRRGAFGCELSGVVTCAGGEFQVGDPVMGVTDHGNDPLVGGSDHACVAELVAPADRFIRLPAGWSFEQGAAFPLSYLYALEVLTVTGNAQRGTRILVHGAATGIGRAVSQIGSALGCEVIEDAAHAGGRSVDLVLDLRRPGAREGVLAIDLDEVFADPTRLRERFQRILALPGVSPAVGALLPVKEIRDARTVLRSGPSAGTVVLAFDPP